MKKLLILTAIFFFSVHLLSQSPFYTVTNMKYQGGITSPKSHPLGGYMALGWNNDGSDGTQTILVRYSESGDTLWTKSFIRRGSLLNRGPVDFTMATDSSGFFLLLWELHPGYGSPVCNAVMKVDLYGDSLWNVQVSPLHEWSGATLSHIKATSDKGFLLAGRSYDTRIIKKYNQKGEFEWSNASSTEAAPSYMRTVEGPDQTYFAVGFASVWRPTGENDRKHHIKKVNAQGNTLWEKNFNSGNISIGDSIRSDGFDVVALSDGGCVTCGRISNPGTSSGPALVMRLDINGDTVWTRKFHFSQTAYKIELVQDGNFLVYMDRGGSSAQGRLVKISMTGETIWTQYGYDYWMSMTGIASDGGVIFSGAHDWHGYFIKASPDGTYLNPYPKSPWNGQTNVFSPTNFWWDESGSRQQTSYYQLQIATDDAFTTIIKDQNNIETNKFDVYNLTSFTKYYWRIRAYGPEGGQSLWSSVYNFTTGEIVGIKGINEWSGFSISQNFPNPAVDKTMLTITLDKDEKIKLQICDVLGHTVFTENRYLSSGIHQIELEVSNLKPGVYFYEVKTNTGKQSKTMCIAL